MGTKKSAVEAIQRGETSLGIGFRFHEDQGGAYSEGT